ncbi:hypothetical protein AU468_10880 [Alkalispirochaeta sphaeroplastigenens]|uniref:Uncharacterized protein n=1 Tax=Alkalispirochaeta sphaeroplastigenens TaxID=1187066 RepID=A0A2S4JHU4_9SPIO|nr:hypothetical protein [Alkalispirochaeta sphaeroplastigenens]POQ99112.1 hypothetical protein AU468_10880 [Alkalispirochaeta sphaeroplastigenens]
MERYVEPRRVQELLLAPSSRVDLSRILSEPAPPAGATEILLYPPAGPLHRGRPPAAAGASGPARGLFLSGGSQGLCALLGEILVARGISGEIPGGPDLRRGVSAAAGPIRLVLPDSFLAWAADRTILWRSLGGVSGPGQVEVRSVGVQEVALASQAGPVWRCRMGGAGWIFLPGGGEIGAPAARGMVRLRDALRGLGVEGELEQTRLPPSGVAPGALRSGSQFVRISSPGWTVFWPRVSLERLLGELFSPAESGSFEALQRGGALVMCDLHLRQGGLGRMVATLPRTPIERQSRHALRTVEELLAAGGRAARTFGETAYRSGDHYRAMVRVARGLSRSRREQLRAALGRRAWEQLLFHSSPEGAAGEPWDAFCRACDLLVGDLERRVGSPGRRPPPAAASVVERFYIEPRRERLQAVWKEQIASGRLEGVLEEARLSWLRGALQRLPRAVLIQAGCGDSSRVQMRLSSAFSRRGRRMYLEDVAVLQEQLRRRGASLGQEPSWEDLLVSRQAVLKAALRACPDRRVTPG